MNKFILFSKNSCGPCRLVDKYMVALQDTRTELIEKVDLEDDSTLPIPQENLNLAKQYGVTATPVLIITNGSGEKLEEFIGGVPITQNIQSMFDKYVR